MIRQGTSQSGEWPGVGVTDAERITARCIANTAAGTPGLAIGRAFAYQGLMNAPLLPIFANGRRQLLTFDALNPTTVKAPDLIDWIKARDPKAIGSWRDLGADEYARAFTAAQTAGFNVIDDLYREFVATLESGGTEEDFAARVLPIMRQKGWLADRDANQVATRVALIYDTNLRLARGAGQWDRIQAGKAATPYLRGATVRDSRVRRPPKSPHSDHRAWDGIILPVDHPFWTRWWTPLGFRCRCQIIQMTRSQLARYPGGITSPEDLAWREERLGKPVFAAPGNGVFAQVAQAVSYENDRPDRMPGLPLVNLNETRAVAARLWTAEAAGAAIEALLTRLFG